jgi:hypothetical protein
VLTISITRLPASGAVALIETIEYAPETLVYAADGYAILYKV